MMSRLWCGRLACTARGAAVFTATAIFFACAFAQAQPACCLFDESYGELLSCSSPGVAVWWASSGWKISQTRPAPTKTGDAMRISAAANEAEAAQFVLRPERPLTGLRVECLALAGTGGEIPAGNVEVLRVRYVPVTTPTDKVGAAAPWPDPLPRIVGPLNLEPGVNQPFWVRVRVPKGTAAGVYNGTIRLRADNCETDVPLRVEVFGFSLPDRMTCTSAFGFSPGRAFKYHNVTTPEQQRQVLDMYLETFSAHHISPYDPAPLDPFVVTWDEKNPEGPTPAFDWTAWDAAMAKAFGGYFFNSFSLPMVGMGGGTFYERTDPSLLGFAENTPQYKHAFSAYCKSVEDHLRAKGRLGDAYVYWFDEPDPKDYEFVMNGFRKLKEAAPGINRMLTEQVEPQLAGGPNIWCMVTPEYKEEPVEARRKEWDRFWWYICTGPKEPYCGLFIDHAATELRVWLWQTWQRRINGILIWETNYWTSETAYPDPANPQNPYEDPMGWMVGYGVPTGVKKPWGNGDGRFMYPPESAADGKPAQPVIAPPVDSIRWEMLRDGVEDYEYHAMLSRLLEQKRDGMPAEQRAGYEALLDVPREITASMTEFTKDPAPIEARRKELAKAIEGLK